ncbi:hypothetical protein GCM10009096_10550 [Parasphingorhabdus litoris]|uniref:Uncharacterized protein n=1 Tax=Parasphingorhabdus litoris TaxID=394733 RepID=A0ABP3K5M8_9SPHN
MFHLCCVRENGPLHSVSNLVILIDLFEQVPIRIEGDLNGSMAHPDLHPFGIHALVDPKGSCGMAERVETEAGGRG